MGILIYRDAESGHKLLGKIDYEIGIRGAFQYDDAYLAYAQSRSQFGISERLPLDARPYASNEFAPFFSGLLPEGEILADLAKLYQVSRNDYLALIEQLGCESIGSLTFVSERIDPREYAPRYEALAQTDIEALASFPVMAAVTTASETRLSLAGAQSKVAWLLPEGILADDARVANWLVPKGTAPSTHIIKVSRKGEEDIALNEMACAILADACGIETAKVTRVAELPGAIAVERYDRAWVGEGTGRRVMRAHQEDFCQAMGLSPFFKYQPSGIDASYLSMAGDLLDVASENPLADKREFAKRIAFNYLVGNADAHLKNSSLLYNRSWTGRRLAPLYDVTCIPLTGYSTKMAFDIGSHRELDDITERDLLAIPIDLDIPLSSFDEAASDLLRILEAPMANTTDAEVAHAIDRILDNAQPRMAVARRLLGK